MKRTSSYAVLSLGLMLMGGSVMYAQQATPRKPSSAEPGQSNPAPSKTPARPNNPQVSPVPSTVEQGQRRTNFRGAIESAALSEQALATCVAIANQEEIAISQFAQDKVQNEKVREFAKMMVKEHTAYLQKIQRWAPETGTLSLDSRASTSAVRTADGATPAAANPPAATTDNAAANSQNKVTPVGGAAPAGAADMLGLHRELAQQCLANAREKLGKKEGKELDECYIGIQLAMHEKMKTTLQVFQRHASGEFAQTLEEGLAATEKHLAKAEEIMKELAGHDHTKTRREERQEKREERRENKDKDKE